MILTATPSDNWALVVAGIVIIVLVFLQWKSFLSTKGVIKQLLNFFPDADKLRVKKIKVKPALVSSDKQLKLFLENPKGGDADEDDEDLIDVSIIVPVTECNKLFKAMINKTNTYLCKNAGTTAEFSILTDICERQLDTLEEEAHNSLNVPLFLGLAGTFTGIILGLIGVNFEEIFSTGEAANLGGLQHLLYGVIGAMFASLMGLGLTVYNSAISYKGAVAQSSNKKDDYFDFLRRELVPTLSNSMSQSLNSLKGVLGHFVDKFGRNLDAYADSASMLNDNLEKQHLVLTEINKLSMTETAAKIAETFQTLKESSESLEVFKTYQNQLNTTVKGMTSAVTKMDDLISEFDGFKAGLNAVVAQQEEHARAQQEFKDAIETHFPTGSEGREVWRTEFDTLISDAKNVTTQLSNQLTASTEHIKNFVEQNGTFFDSIHGLQEAIAAMTQYAKVQATCYDDLKKEIVELRKDYKDEQAEAVRMTQETQKAVKSMYDADMRNEMVELRKDYKAAQESSAQMSQEMQKVIKMLTEKLVESRKEDKKS